MSLLNSRSSLDRILVFAALICALAALFRPNPELPPSPSPSPNLQPLRDELADLRRALEGLSQQPKPVDAAPVAAVSPDGVTIQQLHEWIWQLDQRLGQIDQTAAIFNPLAAPFPNTAQARQVALNVSASPEVRLLALRALRTSNERTADVVQAMLSLQSDLQDSKMRADIFKQLSGMDDPAIKPPLLTALRGDQSAKVREHAAEALASFQTDPSVRAALQAAVQGDPDEKVQKKALEIIEGHRLR